MGHTKNTAESVIVPRICLFSNEIAILLFESYGKEVPHGQERHAPPRSERAPWYREQPENPYPEKYRSARSGDTGQGETVRQKSESQIAAPRNNWVEEKLILIYSLCRARKRFLREGAWGKGLFSPKVSFSSVPPSSLFTNMPWLYLSPVLLHHRPK